MNVRISSSATVSLIPDRLCVLPCSYEYRKVVIYCCCLICAILRSDWSREGGRTRDGPSKAVGVMSKIGHVSDEDVESRCIDDGRDQ